MVVKKKTKGVKKRKKSSPAKKSKKCSTTKKRVVKRKPAPKKATGLNAKTVDELRKLAARKHISITVGSGDNRRKLKKAELIRRLKK